MKEDGFLTKKKGVALISVIFVMVFLGILLVIALVRAEGELRATIAQRQTTIALNAADAGLERAISKFRTDIHWNAGYGVPADEVDPEPLTDTSGNIIGYYRVEVGEADQGAWVTTPVTVTGFDASMEYKKIIKADIIIHDLARFFAFTIGDLTISSGANIDGSLFANRIKFLMPDDPAAPGIIINPQESVLYVDTIEGDSHPKVIIPKPEQSEPLPFPSLDIDYYKALARANGQYSSSNLYLTAGTISEDGNYGNNGVKFARRDVYIKGNVVDPVTVVAGRHIYITGNITYGDDGDENNPGKLGLFARGNIYIHSSAPDYLDIRGLLISDSSTGVFKTLAGSATKDTLNFTGTIAIRGIANNSIHLVAYYNRNYHYDKELREPPPLPYVTYVVTLENRTEDPPSEE